MKKLIKLSAVLTSLVILMSVFTFTAAAESGILIHGKFNYDYANEMLGYINDYRAQNGLKKLKSDFNLTESAMLRAAECSVLCSHTRPNSKQWSSVVEWEEAVAENFAMGFTNPRDATDAYYSSEGHRANMLGDYTRVGVGVFTLDNGTNFWIHIFTCGEVKLSYTETGTRYVNVNVAGEPDDETVISYADGLPTPEQKAEDYEKDNAPDIASVSLSKTEFEYNGRAQAPKVIVKDKDGNTVPEKFYKLTMKKKTSGYGIYEVEVAAKYSDKVFTREYRIIPKDVSVNSLSKNKGALTVRWNRVSATATGVKLLCATNRSFTKGKKIYTLKSNKRAKTIKGLKKGKRYYFKLRVYKEKDDEKLYSDWSGVKSIKY